MGDPESVSDFPDQEQRAAFCFSQWKESMNVNKCKPGGGCCNSCGPVLANAEATGKAKLTTHEGNEVLVVPVVALVEGVLNEYLVQEEDFAKYVNSWEGVPVPVSHPQINGEHVSANLPDVLEARNIGRFHNVKSEDGKLKGEIWVYVESAKKKGFGEIVNKLKAGEIIELSTAYFADTQNQSGDYNGVQYNGIHRNLRPDHLAILPDEIGACSVADGCGTFQNKSMVVNMWEKIKQALGLGDEMEDKKAEILAIIEGEGEDMESKAEDEEMPEENQTEEEKAMAENNQPEANALDEESVMAVNWAKAKYKKEKDSLVSKLKANEKCAFAVNELKAMSVETLEKLDASLSTDYSGRGFPITHINETEEEALEMPLTVLEKKEA